MKSFLKLSFQLFSISMSAAYLMGCASMVSGTNQTITVETYSENKEIEGAQCELRNKGGKYRLTSPDSVSVKRTSDDLIIACKASDLPKGTARADSGLNNAVWGNILLGGVIGLVVDAGTGALNEYPDVIIVKFGKNLFVEDDEVKEINENEVDEEQKPETDSRKTTKRKTQ